MFALVNTLAVPYGYTKEPTTVNMDDSVISCNQFNTSINITGTPLPDILMDLTPPPSPLRRAHSYHFEFPVKQQLNNSSDMIIRKKGNQVHQNNQRLSKELTMAKNVADDLKKIADKFHLDHTKFLGKINNENEKTLDVVIPVVMTRCLQAGLVTLLCWRLLNKLR